MTKTQKLLTVGTSVATALALSPSVAMAQFTNGINLMNTTAGSASNLASRFTIPNMIAVIINIILGAAGLIAFIFLIIGGLQWMLAGGDKEGTEKARKRITAALIGLAIVFSAYALMFIVNAIFGINLLNFSFSNNFQG